MSAIHTPTADVQLRRLKILMVLAIGFALLAAIAGVVLAVADPAAGSSIEATLGFVAAVSGLSAAGFSIGAAIYAQAKNLWRFAPNWIRVTLWTLIVVAIVATGLNLIEQLLGLL